MQDLQCKQIDSEELLKCVFGLKKTELKVFLLLLKNKKSVTSIDLAKQLLLDRTTIQKSVKKLLKKEIVLRKQINLNNGGYVFVYTINEKEKIKQIMKNVIINWEKLVLNQLDKMF